MKRLKKIIININKENKDYPALISYEIEKGSFDALKLDKETSELANELFKALYEHIIALDELYKIYCYDYINNKVVLAKQIESPKNCYLIGADYNSIERVIQKIHYVVSLKKFLIPFYVTINNKMFYLNDRIIQIKQGVKNPKVNDLDTYGMFLKELRPKLFQNIISSYKKDNDLKI